MTTVASKGLPAHKYKRMHKFNQYPRGYVIGSGIPTFMRCECGRRWYVDSDRPKDLCPVRRNA